MLVCPSPNTYPPYHFQVSLILHSHWPKSLLFLTPVSSLNLTLNQNKKKKSKNKKKMIETMNPFSASKTAEIMSKYRPIAPRPETLTPPSDNNSSSSSPGLPASIQKSPYLRNVWAHLQSRPTRTRKRGRASGFAPPHKRPRPCLIPMHAFLPPPPILMTNTFLQADPRRIDLNLTVSPPVELDLMPRAPPVAATVISPRPVRPVGSIVVVERISEDPRWERVVVKGAEEVEEMVEAGENKVPMIVSDSKNKVRMCNSAYKEMVGQPECGWLDWAAGGGGGKRRRIGGEISLSFVEKKVEVWMHGGFKCRVRIEWEKKSVSANCHGVKLECPGNDYQFLWRFYQETDQ